MNWRQFVLSGQTARPKRGSSCWKMLPLPGHRENVHKNAPEPCGEKRGIPPGPGCGLKTSRGRVELDPSQLKAGSIPVSRILSFLPILAPRKDGAAAGGIPLPCPPGMILPGMKPRMLAARRWVEQPASKRGPAYWKGRALRKGRTRWQCGSQLRMTAGTDRPRGTAHMPRPDGVGVGLGEITPSRRVRSRTRPAA